MIIPNELVPYVTSIVNIHNNKSITATMPTWLQQQLPSMPPAPTHQISHVPQMPPAPTHQISHVPQMPPAPIVVNPHFNRVSVYSKDICFVKCFDEYCRKVHYPSIKCKHGFRCDRDRNNRCAFIHDDQKNFMDFLPDNTFNLLNGWEETIPHWIKTVQGRRAHFGIEYVPLQRCNAIGVTESARNIITSAIRSSDEGRYYEDRRGSGRGRSRSCERK
jgi:hypothetical protein